MSTTHYIRQKAGLSQQQLADYLEVSRSAISMAESGLRGLSTAVLRKLAALDAELNDTTEKKGRSKDTSEADLSLEKLIRHHQEKQQFYLLKADKLERRLAVAIQKQQDASAKLGLVESLTSNRKKGIPGNADEDHWINYLQRKGDKNNRLSTAKIQTLTIDIELSRGYAAVHEKILEKLNEKAF